MARTSGTAITLTELDLDHAVHHLPHAVQTESIVEVDGADQRLEDVRQRFGNLDLIDGVALLLTNGVLYQRCQLRQLLTLVLLHKLVDGSVQCRTRSSKELVEVILDHDRGIEGVVHNRGPN